MYGSDHVMEIVMVSESLDEDDADPSQTSEDRVVSAYTCPYLYEDLMDK